MSSASLASAWESVPDGVLRQGDYLPACLVPIFGPDFGVGADKPKTIPVREYDVIVVTQSCDLENHKAPLVAACPVYLLSVFEKTNPAFAKKGQWTQVAKGRIEGLYLLPSPTEASDPRQALVVDLRQVFSLPYPYLEKRARESVPRWRLRRTFVEDFSQTFGRLFMRVALPVHLPNFD